ncbi:nucleotide sugar dehydrogenase [Holospora curviuscula]|uniref:UDP-N-acetyl-D-glucosamine 6-dehydrogenase n=1 Tax=Holospora curviuscula TaxID=1082868 RepID=A0A2S5R740_9PROT|nr:nucleotide sugar dehydrogenase [Holospora curviuscula]PPE03120.1 UDP-N-acetyl-D-glucosamine 6-dehydrogenase [Holospora curviuscula]
MLFHQHPSIGIIGLGYVGLPLAVELSFHFDVVGFDISSSRIEELIQGKDRTQEVSSQRLQQCAVRFTDDPALLAPQSLYIVAVPTPITLTFEPDLSLLTRACKTLSPLIRPGNIVVFESTVYPGVSEDLCGRWLTENNTFQPGIDFFLGYSPERINPGDRQHSLASVTKVVSGQTPEVTNILKHLYGSINEHNIFVAKSIKVAEAAKVLENTQRDINISCINEMAQICQALGISVYDVLDAAETKWNFLPFRPGLVGGHCIGVDPYYLAFCAKQHHVSSHVILAGRHINEEMTQMMVRTVQQLPSGSRIAVLGLTFKEGVPDVRNSKAIEVVQALKQTYSLDVFDPYAQAEEVFRILSIPLNTQFQPPYDAILLLVPHTVYTAMQVAQIESLLRPQGYVFDIKGIWRSFFWKDLHYWTL